MSRSFFLRSQGAEYHAAAGALARGEADAAGLAAPDRALLAFAEKLTREPAAVTDGDLEALRTHGFDDAHLWEATFTAAIFNLFTRMADAFGIEPPLRMVAALGLED